jgi:energy-coupling factor transport system permease protein
MTAVFNLFDGEGRVLLHWKIFKITEGGLISTGLVAFRFFYLIIGSSILTYTTLPVNMTDGLEHLFGFLKKIRVPVSELAMIMTIALRFIPIIMEELDKLTKAQMSRGADFESGNIAKRIKAYAPVFIPLFVSAVRRASELAMAMDARCYQGGEGRTRLRPLSYTGKDLAAFVILAVYIALICVGRIMPLVLKG